MNFFIFIILDFLIKSTYESYSKNKIKNIQYNNNTLRQLIKKEEIQKLNNIINIYNPYKIVSYISSATNKNGDLFITTNTEERIRERLIYAIKSDGSNYFNDNKTYKVLYSSTNDSIIYPMLSFLKINEKEYIVSLTFDSVFETIDYYENVVYAQGLFLTLKYNSNINKNIFISLNYYDNKDYILIAYTDRHDRMFSLNLLFFGEINIESRRVECPIKNSIGEGDMNSQVTCFEIGNFVECMYVNEYKYYTLSIFNISNLSDILLNEEISDNNIHFKQLFSKCIHIKEYIGAYIYFLEDNSSPIIKFINYDIIENKLEKFREKIKINSDNKYYLGSIYIYNDIIKVNENNLYFVNTKNESDILIIIMIKLFDNSTNVLLNYYKIELKEQYNIRIYKDITIFKYNKLLGIGMTNYDYNLDNENKTYANYFLIGESFEKNITIPSSINIFDEENNYEVKIAEFVNIKNNIFGYTVKEVRILSPLSEENLGFYIFSKELEKNIETNELISINDIINFTLISDLGVKLDNYSFELEGIVSEADSNDFISFPDSYEYYSNDNISFELIYEPQKFDLRKAFINLSVNYCYKTCKTCTYLGDKYNHHCDTCSDEYPVILNVSNSTLYYGHNCINICPTNYTLNKYKKCQYIDIYNDNNYNNDYTYNNRIIELITFEKYKEIKSQIKEISDNNIIINNISNYTIYGYEIGLDRENFCIENGLINIDLVDAKKDLINLYNLDKDTNIYILIVESESSYNNPLTNDFDFVLILENGTELDLSYINEDIIIDISAPIIDLEKAHYDYAVAFSEQGYDIYDINSTFYEDFCISAYFNGNDIPIQDRRKEVYPYNYTIVNPYCNYKMADLINKRFICEYDIKDYINNNKSKYNVSNNNYFENEEDDSFISYFLDNINYKILTCTEVFLTLQSYNHNIGVIFSFIISFLVICLIIIYFFHGFPKFKKLIYNEVPTYYKLQKLIEEQKCTGIDLEKYKIYITNPVKRNISNKKVTISKSTKDVILRTKLSSSSLKSNSSIAITKNANPNMNSIYKRKPRYTINVSNRIISKFGMKKSESFNERIKKKLGQDEENNEKPKNVNDIEDLPFMTALRYDKRNILQIFWKKTVNKLEIIDIILEKEIKELPLSKYFLFILIDLTINALLYSDKVVSNKSHNNGQLDFFVTMILTIVSNLISVFIDHYLSLLTKSEEVIEIIKDIKQEYIFLKVCKTVFKIVAIKSFIYFLLSIIIIIFCFYYLTIFCAIYNKSQKSLLMNYIISFIEGIIIKVIIIIVITITRKFGISYKNKYIYNTSNYLDNHF